MDKIEIHLENCYGIKKLKHSFDFTKSKAHLIYAPNGAMKSSFAKTFEDISLNTISKDRIFTERINHREVKLDNRDITNDEIFVIQRMKEVDFKGASTILANETLKKLFDETNLKLNDSKKDFIKVLLPNFGLKENQVELEIGKAFNSNFYTILENKETEVNNIVDPLYTNIIYSEIFNDKVLKFLGDKEFNLKIKEYIEVYDKLINENTTLFMKGSFNHYNADTVTKSLKDNNFFAAKHKVKINGQEIEGIKELEALIKEEKDKVLNNPELTNKFNEIDKALNGNAELRNFRSYVENNQEIIKEFADLNNFRKKLILNYFSTVKNEYNVLLKLNNETKIKRQEIIDEAKKEQDDWKTVLGIFKSRFTVPFELNIKNQEDVILKNEPASLIFKYTDGAEPSKELGGVELQESLSTGEQRVFYLLNIIFQIEARKKINKNQLIIVDDIADSFDYKNKYAIIEYLKDILSENKFNMIILTHNFDFYKTIKSRLSDNGLGVNNWEGNWVSIKKDNEISLIPGEKRDVFVSLRNDFGNCELSFISCIPFVRNLIEYTIGKDNVDYLTLTSLLHLKPERVDVGVKETKELLKSDVLPIFNKLFGLAINSPNPNEKIFDKIIDIADNIILSDELIMDIKNKICLSLAIRLKAEEFILNKITNAVFISNILTKETGKIIGQYKNEFPGNTAEINVLDRVNLMTPENIHINSFMYEPIMDLSEDHLRKLYIDVKGLN